jgi:hypothetical protein
MPANLRESKHLEHCLDGYKGEDRFECLDYFQDFTELLNVGAKSTATIRT